MIKVLKKISEVIRKVETAALVFCVMAMVIITFAQIILRNAGGLIVNILGLFVENPNVQIGAIDWFDTVVRYLVLWSGMIAAGITTHDGKHIKIDLAGRFTKGPIRKIINVTTALFAGAVSLLLSLISAQYIAKLEYPEAEIAFLNIPRWVLLLILPIGFFIIGIRFFIRGGGKLIRFHEEDESPEESLEEIKIEN